ncbi:MAG TPA: aldo/keto reductase, partial [Clostridia bacterium]|nr:aldo/keto reductase [Clostridia bacterium]
MVYRTMKNTGLPVSLLGLGCMRLPRIDPGRDDIDYEKAQEIVDYAMANGINYFDTAHMYHGGGSEVFIGKAFEKYDRSTFCLATKMPVWMADAKKDVERIFNLQLERMKTDYIDFYLVHSVNKGNLARCKEFGVYEYLLKKKEEGIIKHLGFSFHDSPEVLEETCAAYDWDFAQLQLNYIDWVEQNAKLQYEILVKYGLPCIVMEPVRGGALASPCERANKLFLSARPDKSIASWAIRFAASLPNVLTVLSGMSNMEQIIDNVNTLNDFQPLTDDEQAIIEKAREEYRLRDAIPCTGCRYCMDC